MSVHAALSLFNQINVQIMQKEIKLAFTNELFGASMASVVKSCCDILRKHHCVRLADAMMRMPVKKAYDRLKYMCAM